MKANFEKAIYVLRRLGFSPKRWWVFWVGEGPQDPETGHCRRTAMWQCACDGVLWNYLCWRHALEHRKGCSQHMHGFFRGGVTFAWRVKWCEVNKEFRDRLNKAQPDYEM